MVAALVHNTSGVLAQPVVRAVLEQLHLSSQKAAVFQCRQAEGVSRQLYTVSYTH